MLISNSPESIKSIQFIFRLSKFKTFWNDWEAYLSKIIINYKWKKMEGVKVWVKVNEFEAIENEWLKTFNSIKNFKNESKRKADVFEFLKRLIRAAIRLSPRAVVEKILDQARGVNQLHMSRIRKHQLEHIIELTSASVQR